MASGGKKKTTMAKLAREQKLRERRVAKQARKEARKNGTFEPRHDPSDIDGEHDLDREPGVAPVPGGAPTETGSGG
jgi:hypothetical protein